MHRQQGHTLATSKHIQAVKAFEAGLPVTTPEGRQAVHTCAIKQDIAMRMLIYHDLEVWNTQDNLKKSMIILLAAVDKLRCRQDSVTASTHSSIGMFHVPVML